MRLLSWFCPVMQAAFLFTVVGTTGFLGVLAGQLPGVASSTLLFKIVHLFSVSVVTNYNVFFSLSCFLSDLYLRLPRGPNSHKGFVKSWPI